VLGAVSQRGFVMGISEKQCAPTAYTEFSLQHLHYSDGTVVEGTYQTKPKINTPDSSIVGAKSDLVGHPTHTEEHSLVAPIIWKEVLHQIDTSDS
jgi:hypothetical protein